MLVDFVIVGITYNKEMVSDVKQLVLDMRHVSYKTNCHDSHIDDHNRNLRELMGTVDCIQEDLQKIVQMNQCNHCQDHPGEATQAMEEFSITQLVGFLEKLK